MTEGAAEKPPRGTDKNPILRRRQSDSDAVTSTIATMRIVVIGLITVAILCVIATSVLAFYRRPSPDAVIGVGSAAVGALSTLVARAGRAHE
jgi:hypothetical protein